MKRANGQGSISFIKGRSKPYRALAPAKLEEYRYKSYLIGYFKTKREAQQALNEWLTVPHSDRPNMTLEQLFKEWKVTAYRDISMQTRGNYDAAWNRIKPLGGYKVRDIKTNDFQKIIDDISDNYSLSMLGKIKTVCVMLEDFAVQNDLINKNYARFIKLPKKEQKEKPIFTEDQVRIIAKGARNNVGIADQILVMIFTGWRIQEFCNLTQDSYNREEHTLTGGLKTEAGKNRTVYIPDFLTHIVEKYANLPKSALFCEIRESIGEDGKRENEYISWKTTRFRFCFEKTLDRLGIARDLPDGRKITPHSTRHTYNSLLFERGVNVETRMRLMGQVSEHVNKKVYTHAEKRILMQAVNSLKDPLSED